MASPAGPLLEERINVSNNLVCNSSGLALDIGGSIAKLAYRPKDIYKDGLPLQANKSKGELHVAMFPASDIDALIAYCQNKCDLRRGTSDPVLVTATGVGSSVHKDLLEEKLGIKIKILDEFTCAVEAFRTMTSRPDTHQLFLPQSRAAKLEGERITNSYKLQTQLQQRYLDHNLFPKEWAEKLGMPAEKSPVDGESDDTVKLPAILAICGSASILILVNSDGTHNIIDGINMGGRFFVGAGNALVGTKDHSTLVEMAKTGDGKSVDTYYSDLLKGKSGENIYEADDNDKLVYPFGKLSSIDKDAVKKDDLIHSLASVVGTVHAQVIQLNALVHGVRDVYFCGNQFNSEGSRGPLETMHLVRSCLAPQDKKVNFKFLRSGGFYGALGAYIHGREDRSDSSSEEQQLNPVVQSTHF